MNQVVSTCPTLYTEDAAFFPHASCLLRILPEAENKFRLEGLRFFSLNLDWADRFKLHLRRLQMPDHSATSNLSFPGVSKFLCHSGPVHSAIVPAPRLALGSDGWEARHRRWYMIVHPDPYRSSTAVQGSPHASQAIHRNVA